MTARSAWLVGSLALASALAHGCAAPTDVGPSATASNDIVDVPQTDIERQSIGASWLHAHATWAAALHTKATGENLDIAPAYWTYWHWFDQLVGGVSTTISTGGNFETANGIVRKYGLVAEGSLLPRETPAELATRQTAALAGINLALATGALKGPTARHDRALVRRELDRVWGLSPEASMTLDAVFGATVSRTLASTSSPADVTGSPVLRAADFAVAYTTTPGGPVTPARLSQAMTDWREAYYPANDRRVFQQRVQKALLDAQPVIITWFVDFNALESRDGNPLRGSFNLTTLHELGPGVQGGHTTVLLDYQARLADGRLLVAGNTLDPTNAADKTVLDSALLPSTQMEFLRVKNAWGVAHPDRAFAPGMPTYENLYFDYLDGPVKKCVERNGVTDTSSCPSITTPLQNVVLPPGY